MYVYVENETCARGGGQAWVHDGPEPTLGIKVKEERETLTQRERDRGVDDPLSLRVGGGDRTLQLSPACRLKALLCVRWTQT